MTNPASPVEPSFPPATGHWRPSAPALARAFLVLAIGVLTLLPRPLAAAPIVVTLSTGDYRLGPGFGCGRDPGDDLLCLTADSRIDGRRRFLLEDGESRTFTFGIVRLREDADLSWEERNGLRIMSSFWFHRPTRARVRDMVAGTTETGPFADAESDLRFDFDPFDIALPGGGTLTVEFGDLDFTAGRQALRHLVTVSYAAADPTAVPEPPALILLGAGLLALCLVRKSGHRRPVGQPRGAAFPA